MKYALIPAFAVFLLSTSTAFPVFAATESSAKPDAAELMHLLQQQQDQLAEQQKQLEAQKERVKLLTSQVNKLLEAKTLENLAPAAGPKKSGPGSEPETVGIDRRPRDKDRPPRIEAVREEGGVLLRPGQATLEPALEYSRSSALRVAIEGFAIIPALNIGSFQVTEVDRDTFISSATGRLGLFKNLEGEIRVPYVYRNDTTLGRPLGTGSSEDERTDVSGNDIGDVEVALRSQLYTGHGNWPFLIGNLRFKSTTGTGPFDVAVDPDTGLETELPTGSGFYAVQPSITAILPSDPVVLYSSLGYLYNMKRDVGGGIGEIDPGDSISAGFGMGFAVNERVSFSLGYSHSYVMETTQNGDEIPNSNDLQVGSLLFGLGYRVTDATSVNLNVDAGLTDDAPDARVIVRVPMHFTLF